MKAIACTLGLMLIAATWTAPATALDITFESVDSTGNPIVGTLETSGYRFTADSLRVIGTPGTYVTDGSAVYIARTVTTSGGITLVRADGTPFDLYEFDAAGPFALPSAAANAQRVGLFGARPDGGLLTAFYSLSGFSGFDHFVVPAGWSSLASVTFTGIFSDATPGALALDDVGVGLGPGSAVPEPTSLLLVLTTALGLGALIVRHRVGRSARRRP
jgi:hypothetical protein